MLQFYLLMRGIRRLGLEYRTDLHEIDPWAIANRRAAHGAQYDWPPQRTWQSQSHTGGSGPSDLTSVVAGEERDEVGVVGVDAPLSERFVQALANTDPETKVMHYLDSIVPGEYDFHFQRSNQPS